MLDIRMNQLGDIIIIDLQGEFDIDVIRKVEQAWNNAVSKNPKVIGFNFKDLMFIDSSAIGTVVKFVNSAANKNIALALIDVGPAIAGIFKTSRLEKFFNVCTKEDFERKYFFAMR